MGGLSEATEWCPDCEGTGDMYVDRPQHDDPYLRVRRWGVPCPTCNGKKVVPVEHKDDEE